MIAQPVGGFFGGALEGLEIDIEQAVALLVPGRPFEIVEDAPYAVGGEVQAQIVGGAKGLLDVPM